MTGRHPRHTAAAARALEDEDVGPRLLRLDRGAHPRATEPDDDDVGLVAPFRDLLRFDHAVLRLAHVFLLPA